jgi:hypothetical protein
MTTHTERFTAHIKGMWTPLVTQKLMITQMTLLKKNIKINIIGRMSLEAKSKMT